GVNHPLRGENGDEEGDDEVGGIGVKGGGVLEGMEVEEGFEKGGEGDVGKRIVGGGEKGDEAKARAKGLGKHRRGHGGP
ncbi:hypothetical protein, partial [Neisseria sicca]|uniref:hypothetical protein n=1 Tax=Neisseria sicca TaxID=490 RepID=UPI001C99C771